MMRVLVNGAPFGGLQTGISRYAQCLYRELEQMPDTTVAYLMPTGVSSTMPAPAEATRWCRQTRRFWRLPDLMIVAITTAQRLRYEYNLRTLGSIGFDLYHETDFFPPARCPVPVVFTLHDLSLLNYPDKHPRERVWYFNLFFRRRLQRADRIVTVSEFVRGELVRQLAVAPERVSVVHEAASPVFGPRPRSQIKAVIRRLGLPEDYVLFVGTQEPRKNLRLLIEALARLDRKIPLVLAGWTGWGSREWVQRLAVLGLRDRVFVTGYVAEETLVCLYGGARVMVYPSLYEGFGLPLLEAMACGCPVICSNTASLPEVAGEAALFIDPRRVESLVAALNQVLTQETLRNELVAAGFKRAEVFSWRKSAWRTREIFHQTISRAQRGPTGGREIP